MYELFLKIVALVEYLGYFGIFIMTMIESTFVPIPSEVTLIPAGFLVSQGKMNGPLVLFISVLGTLAGSLINYMIAYKFGRSLLINYGRYFFLNAQKFNKIETFFTKHGAISTFTGRLLPGVKHFISFPAGLGRMNVRLFCVYTALGGAIWSFILLALGYFIGENTALIKLYIKQINFILFVSVVCIIAIYVWVRQSSKKRY